MSENTIQFSQSDLPRLRKLLRESQAELDTLTRSSSPPKRKPQQPELSIESACEQRKLKPTRKKRVETLQRSLTLFFETYNGAQSNRHDELSQ